MNVPPPNSNDRILTSLRALILREYPNLSYAGLWEYVVTGQNDDGSLNGQPTDTTIPLPDMNRIPFGALALGGVSNPQIGSRFLVEFGNQDGSKYMVVSVEQARESTIDASEIVNVGSSDTGEVVMADGSRDVSRNGDGITVWFPTGLLNGTLVSDPNPPGTHIPIVDMPIQLLNPAPGIITGGQTRVRL